MARIETILTQGDLHSGPTSPFADATDFGAQKDQAIGQLGQAGQHAASSLTDVASAIDHKRQMDDTVWASTSIEQEKAYVNKWMADPQNSSKDTFPDDLRKLMQDRLNTYNQTAKSTRALNQFKLHYQNFMSERYESALTMSTRNQLSKNVLAFDKQTADVLTSFRESANLPVDRREELMGNLGLVNQNIDAAFGKIAPATAQKLRDNLTSQVAYGVMLDDPNLAKRVIDANPGLDEHERYTISNHIDTARFSKNAAEMESFNLMRNRQFNAAQIGESQDKIGLERYQSYMPRDKAQAMKMKDDALIDTYNKSNKFYDGIKSWDPRRQTTELQKLYNPDDLDAMEIVARKVQQNAELEKKDRVSWLQQNNPYVKDALTRAMKSTDNDRMGALGEMYDMTLRYQGPAPADATDKERPMYLDRPTNDRHLMTLDEAEQHAIDINKGTPTQMMSAIQTVLNRYPGDKYQNIAYNDMVSLPRDGRGIKQEYQLAFLNQRAHWVNDYLGAIQKTDSIKSLATDKRKDYDDALRADSNYIQLSHAIMGSNFQRGDQVEGFKNGILTYANALAIQGMSPSQAVKESSRKLIAEEMGFFQQNGQTTMVMRDRGPGKPPRSDDDIKTIGKNLALSMQFIPTSEIDTRNFDLRAIGTPEAKRKAVSTAVAYHGYWGTEPDGQSVSLYYADGKNNFQMRDTQGRPFMIPLEELEQDHTLSMVNRGSAFGEGGIPFEPKGVHTRSSMWPLKFWGFRAAPDMSDVRPNYIHRGTNTPIVWDPKSVELKKESNPLASPSDERE